MQATPPLVWHSTAVLQIKTLCMALFLPGYGDVSHWRRIGSDYWSDMKWYAREASKPPYLDFAQSALMFNFAAADGSGNPRLPGTSSCKDGCGGIVTVVSSDGSYIWEHEFYAQPLYQR
ncbi:hypothetical protein C8J56DRAFT_1052259 [Mycena floridula]|nr:hypothetical protein C8J56DRAFT_1052259 [Mycena floridula]